jgi:hypothetical protein
MVRFSISTAILGFLLCAAPGLAAEPVDYQKQIKPVLQARCYACHGALKQEANLRLDTAALIQKGGDGGPALQPGDVEASRIVQRVSATDESERMPPEGEPLKPEEIAALKAWIADGAKGPPDEQPERDPRDHWAFRTPVRPSIPNVADPNWSHNPIDAFIAAKHAEHGLTAQPQADKRTWLRRVSLDLIGLPPTVAEQEAFLADDSATAYETVVNRLLDSPHYGERWGRHWMDIWRYSDWWGLGAEVRNSQKHIWHWRDWIIESLNADKGYDQMLREMLAADELYPDDLDRLRATGYLARQYFKFNRTSWLDETIEHTSKAMLGLTLNCGKCHDHKYDPFSQVEYYQLRAFFEPYQIRTDAVPGEIDFDKNGIPRAFDCNLDAPTYLHIRGDDRNPDKSRTIMPTLPRFLSFDEFPIEPVTLPTEAHQPGLRSFVEEAYLKNAEAKIAESAAAVETARMQFAQAEAAAKLAELDPANNGPVDALAAIGGHVLVKDDFSVAMPDVWEIRGGEWKYLDGTLKQLQVGAKRAAIRLKKLPPADFEARLTYVPTGGETWKSVGISFDVSDTSEVLAYLSSVVGGSKSQIAYGAGGNYSYPAGAAEARSIELNQRHELILRVRGTLLNVVVNGRPSIAFRLPIPRNPGALELITYDAAAEFVSFELRELPPSFRLADAQAPASNAQPNVLPLDQARLNLVIAELSLKTAQTQPASIKARAAADRAKFQQPPPQNLAVLIAQAAKAERILAAAKAEEDAVRAELELLKAAPDKKADAEKKQTAAQQALETARKAIDQPGETYTSLIGSLKTLENNLETEESRRKPFPAASTGRRTALAKWITDPRHPLTARVCVNHLWNRHFGKGLVPTVFDFGRKGTPPTHPELLDWLAVELVEHGWSMKRIHRLIVTSQTYRMTSSKAEANLRAIDIDPDNVFYWRRNPIRMEAQLVRDSLLHLAGELDPKLGGPSIPVSDENTRRRSLYFVHSHNEHQKFLSMFDDASVLECYRRADSIVPQQALALENSPLATAMAGTIAKRIEGGHPLPDAEFVRRAFLAVLCDEPNEAELKASVTAVAELTAAATAAGRPDPVAAARANLILALLNHNDFVTVR